MMQMQTSQFVMRCCVVVLAAMSIGCSKQPSSAKETPWLPESGEVVRAEVNAGGIPTTYAAYFDRNHVHRIGEIRKEGAREGEYTFEGARLIRYKGAALGSNTSIDLTFDMQGALTAATGGPDEKEISAIRTRAQLLRSLALAKRSSMGHGS